MRDACFLTVLVLAFSTIGSTHGQEAVSPGLKANLDLPFDAGGAKESEEEESPETVVFYGEQYEGTGFFFCCEKELGCDGGVAFRRVQKEVQKSIAQLSERTELGLVFFDSEVKKFPESGEPLRANPGNKMAATKATLKAQPGFGSCTQAALISALDFAGRSSAYRKAIIYIGEGRFNCPGLDGNPLLILKAVRSRNTARIPIHTVGTSVGHAVNEDWLKQLAAQNGGTYRRAEQ